MGNFYVCHHSRKRGWERLSSNGSLELYISGSGASAYALSPLEFSERRSQPLFLLPTPRIIDVIKIEEREGGAWRRGGDSRVFCFTTLKLRSVVLIPLLLLLAINLFAFANKCLLAERGGFEPPVRF